ncbi:hypothetical protein EA462_12400 [Natrarchaeobius halalkaliphilus]|uniref:Uncharacterized protein n=1 Tax=Natrarchaeobius halalkaliphilus TaxID=1679091 RepID=A0A3N6M232_9EURY|nr:hypothetical protein [Natrarchaeobius halalkaliphilus]RQG89161.1 hypothetical protein EA462_12400 [Natrarchaeobius halalkaliphilus]
MSPDHPPIPREALPPGWGLAEHRDDRFSYRCSRLPIELVADATIPRPPPGLGLCRCWELRYSYSLGEQPISEAIGRVSTRHAATEGLLECMNRVHETVEDAEDVLYVRTVLERVSLSSLVPERVSESA